MAPSSGEPCSWHDAAVVLRWAIVDACSWLLELRATGCCCCCWCRSSSLEAAQLAEQQRVSQLTADKQKLLEKYKTDMVRGLLIAEQRAQCLVSAAAVASCCSCCNPCKQVRKCWQWKQGTTAQKCTRTRACCPQLLYAGLLALSCHANTCLAATSPLHAFSPWICL
jgi:hypothetical protein